MQFVRRLVAMVVLRNLMCIGVGQGIALALERII